MSKLPLKARVFIALMTGPAAQLMVAIDLWAWGLTPSESLRGFLVLAGTFVSCTAVFLVIAEDKS